MRVFFTVFFILLISLESFHSSFNQLALALVFSFLHEFTILFLIFYKSCLVLESYSSNQNIIA
jgi:hypothetical protein